jgi:predicted SnoaL-like aldol condensation-catalyzing enzyme
MTTQQETTSRLNENKRMVKEFYETAFNKKDPRGAVQRYVGRMYRQHNPMAADGSEAFIEFVTGFTKAFPKLHVDIKRMLADGDLVMTHSRITRGPDDRGIAAMDLFRIEDGRIVEHWDILQDIPEESANGNTMF